MLLYEYLPRECHFWTYFVENISFTPKVVQKKKSWLTEDYIKDIVELWIYVKPLTYFLSIK